MKWYEALCRPKFYHKQIIGRPFSSNDNKKCSFAELGQITLFYDCAELGHVTNTAPAC